MYFRRHIELALVVREAQRRILVREMFYGSSPSLEARYCELQHKICDLVLARQGLLK